MKTYINKINTYLLERYPTIWNTKIVWMFTIAIVIHALFFVFGFILFTNIDLLKERGASSLFFENGTIFFSIMVTVILLVVWLSQLFKNNAFKSLYPTNRLKLFGQFFQYFLIVFICSTFYYSFSAGVKSYINLTYDTEAFEADIAAANNGSVFLSHQLNDYTVNNRKYPQPFDTIYCEDRPNFIDYSLPSFSFYDKTYQFYTLSKKFRNKNERYVADEYQGFVYTTASDDIVTYYYKDKALDSLDILIPYTQTSLDEALITKPSYYNYSGVFFETNSNSYYNYNSYKSYPNNRENSKQEAKITRNKRIYELLQRNEEEEITTILSDFLKLTDKYKISNNLDLDTWKRIVFQKKGFQISQLIRDEFPRDFRLYNTNEKTAYQKHVESITSDFYIVSEELFYSLENIKDIKNGVIINESMHVFLWIAFFIATTIFVFRVTNIRLFIFTLIASVLLMIFIGLALVFLDYIRFGRQDFEYVVFYFNIFLSLIILSIPLFFLTKIRKSISAVFMNISIVGFPAFLFMVIMLISTYQRDACLSRFKYSECPQFFDVDDLVFSFGLLVLSFIFIFFYTSVIKKWRALPKK